MRILKLFLISLLFFLLLLTAVGLLFPAHVQVSRATDLPGQRRSVLMGLMQTDRFQSCLTDSANTRIPFTVATDSSLVWQQGKDTRVVWTFHGREGQVTLQAVVQTRLGWLPWQRFRSLLMEPRYGPWLETRLERFKDCLDRAHWASEVP